MYRFFLKKISKKIKRCGTAFVFCVLFVGSMFCVGGCVSAPEWVLMCGNTVVWAGEYVELIANNLQDARAKTVKSNIKYKNHFDPIRESFGFRFLDERSIKNAKQLVLLKHEFYTQNLYDKEWVKRDFNQHLNTSFDSTFEEFNKNVNANAERIGLPKINFVNDGINNSIGYAVFKNEFGEGRPRHISKEDYDNFTRQAFMKFKIVKVPKDINDPIYSEVNDSAVGSKLEKKAGVKTPKDLVEKYMGQLKGESSIDDIIKNYNEFLGAPNSEPQFNIVCKFNEQKSDSELEEINKFISEVEPGSEATLKETEKSYVILQKFDLTDEDVKNNTEKSKDILNTQKMEEYVNELEQKFLAKGEKIIVNEKVLKKYTAENQARLMEKHMPAPKNKFEGMPPDLM